MPPITSERYELEDSMLGHGGFGDVYRAFDLLHEEMVVIKTISLKAFYDFQRDEIRRRFFTEALVGAKLGRLSSCIVKVLDYGYDQKSDCPFFVMEYVAGDDLVNQLGTFSPRDAFTTLAQLLHAVQVSHENGVLHCDISPDNIMYVPSIPMVKLNDFGLARVLTSDLFSRGRSVSLLGGKNAYIPPCQITTNERNQHTDLFAVGMVIHELISGSKVSFEWVKEKSVLKMAEPFKDVSTDYFTGDIKSRVYQVGGVGSDLSKYPASKVWLDVLGIAEGEGGADMIACNGGFFDLQIKAEDFRKLVTRMLDDPDFDTGTCILTLRRMVAVNIATDPNAIENEEVDPNIKNDGIAEEL